MPLFKPLDFFDLSSFPYASIFFPEKNVWEYLNAIESFISAHSRGGILGSVAAGAYLVHPESIVIGKGSIVEPGAYIQGPCLIGEDCQIRHGAYIRGNFIAGNKCVIGHATEIKNSIFLDGAQAGHFAYVGDSIVGSRVNLGAGTKCANLRFDRKSIILSFEGRKIDTGLRKLGAIFGDDTQTGCNSVTSPGTLVGKESFLGPCAVAKGVLPQRSIVKASESVILS